MSISEYDLGRAAGMVSNALGSIATAIDKHAKAQVTVAKINANSDARVAGQTQPYSVLEF